MGGTPNSPQNNAIRGILSDRQDRHRSRLVEWGYYIQLHEETKKT